MTSHQMVELLRVRYQPPEWACFTEIRVPGGRDRFIDFLAANVWESKRGRTMAYEIKVSRSDFARELKIPEKRAAAERVATDCYFAVPKGLVKPDEVPEGWGLIEANAGGLRVKKHAMSRKVEPWAGSFVRVLLRRICDGPPLRVVPKAIVAGEEMTRDEILAMVKDDEAFLMDAAQDFIERESKRRIWNYESMESRYETLLDQLKEITGEENPWAIRTWLEKQKAVPTMTLSAMQHARDAIDAAIAAVNDTENTT